MTSELERAIRDALGVEEKEPIELEFITPQFERQDDIQPADPSSWDREAWEALSEMSGDALKALGCRRWEAVGESQSHMLFPGEWYDHIPEGLEVLNILGDRRGFSKEHHSDDIRFGCLAYGVVVEDE